MEKGWFETQRADKVVEALKKRGFEAWFVPSSKAAVDKVLEIVSVDESIGFGGSVTLEESGIITALQKRGNKFITDPQEPYGPKFLEQRRQALTSDVYLTSTNALTESGILVNIDGTGNRVASMVFGPKAVIIVAGKNKIAPTLEDAIGRARNYAAVLNAKRFNANTPCIEEGKCVDCDSPARICRIVSIIEGKPSTTPVKVILVGEDLGF